MCDQLDVARQGYYRWRSAGPCERERIDVELTEQILQIHTELDGNPGVRRVWVELVTRGVRGPSAYLPMDRSYYNRGDNTPPSTTWHH
jgi:hypothetical protein